MMTNKTKGLLCCFGANSLWGSAILFWPMLAYLGEATVLSQRMIWSCLFVFLLLLFTKRLGKVKEIAQNLPILFTLMLAAAVLCANWILYLWSLNNDKAIEVSLGYYITPIINIFMARIFLKEPISNLQLIAISIAFLAVSYGIFSYGNIPVFGLAIGITFAIYGYLHKVIAVDPMSALFIETLCVVPFALVWLHFDSPESYGVFGFGTKHYFLLLGTVLFTGIPLMFFSFATKNLNLTTIGFLQYLSPSINFILAVFVVGEPVKPVDYVMFPLVWLALSIFSWDMVIRHRNIAKIINK